MTPAVFRCRMCRTKMPEAFFVIRKGRVLVSGKHARHYADTHGIPGDVLIDMAGDYLDRVRDGFIAGPVDATVIE